MVQIKIENGDSESDWETIVHHQPIDDEKSISPKDVPQYQCTDQQHLVITNLPKTTMDIRYITKTTMEGYCEEKYISHRLSNIQVVGKKMCFCSGFIPFLEKTNYLKYY